MYKVIWLEEAQRRKKIDMCGMYFLLYSIVQQAMIRHQILMLTALSYRYIWHVTDGGYCTRKPYRYSYSFQSNSEVVCSLVFNSLPLRVGLETISESESTEWKMRSTKMAGTFLQRKMSSIYSCQDRACLIFLRSFVHATHTHSPNQNDAATTRSFLSE